MKLIDTMSSDELAVLDRIAMSTLEFIFHNGTWRLSVEEQESFSRLAYKQGLTMVLARRELLNKEQD